MDRLLLPVTFNYTRMNREQTRRGTVV